MPPHTTRAALAGPLRLSRKVSPSLDVSPRTNESTEVEAEEEEEEEEADEAEEEEAGASVACQALSSLTWFGIG